MKVKCKELLNQLKIISPGLSTKDVIEQSSCYVFHNGQIITFNDEIACFTRFDLGVEGAVAGKAFVGILNKWSEELVEITSKGSKLRLLGPGKRSSIVMEETIALAVDEIEEPPKDAWKKLPENFAEIVNTVSSCVSSDESRFIITCINLTPEWVEASDDLQIIRYPVKLDIEESMLVKGKSLVGICSMGVTEYSTSKNWIHFRNKQIGYRLSCRRYLDDYPDVTAFLNVEGEPIEIPKHIDDAITRAEIFSSEDVVSNAIKVTMANGNMTLKGEGPSGDYEEIFKKSYKGDQSIEFNVDPKLLLQLLKRSNSWIVSDSVLKANTDEFDFVTCTVHKAE